MKFYETHFEEYITENNRDSLHPKLEKIYEKLNQTFPGATGAKMMLENM